MCQMGGWGVINLNSVMKEAGSRRQEAIKFGNKEIPLDGGGRIFAYDEGGNPITGRIHSLSTNAGKPMIDVSLGGTDRTEIPLSIFEELEVSSKNEKEKEKQDLPKITSFELDRLYKTAIHDELTELENEMKKRIDVKEGEIERRVLLDGREVIMIVDDNDFGLIVELKDIFTGKEIKDKDGVEWLVTDSTDKDGQISINIMREVDNPSGGDTVRIIRQSIKMQDFEKKLESGEIEIVG